MDLNTISVDCIILHIDSIDSKSAVVDKMSHCLPTIIQEKERNAV